jgi:hypothetical protein
VTEQQRITGLAEQIELARKYREEWPDWLRSAAYFSGSNHPGDVKSEPHEQEFSEGS